MEGLSTVRPETSLFYYQARTDHKSRFWPKVDRSGPCWTWKGAIKTHQDGLRYGNVYVGGGRKTPTYDLAHRVAWRLTFGPIPIGLFVCHRCDNPTCVYPQHLFLGDHQSNMVDMATKGRRAIRRGEEISKVLTEPDVKDIRRRKAAGETIGVIAARYGTSYGTVNAITLGKSWKHLI